MPEVVTQSEWQTMWRELLKRLGALSPVLEEIGEVFVRSIQTTFREGGRFGNDNEFGGGSQKWTRSLRARQQSGQTLVDTAMLRSSITYRVTGNALVVGTNLPYAAIHNFGGHAGRNGKVHLMARPFMVIQNEDLASVTETLIDYYSRLI